MNVYRFINKIKMFNTQFLVKQFNKSAAMKKRKKRIKVITAGDWKST